MANCTKILKIKGLVSKIVNNTLVFKIVLAIYSVSLVSYLIYYLAYVDAPLISLMDILFILTYCVFIYGGITYFQSLIRSKRYFDKIGSFDMSLDELNCMVKDGGYELPKFAILVPARNEGYVIENTILRLSKLDYPKKLFKIVIIVDEREDDDIVEIKTKDVVSKLAKSINKQNKGFIECIEVPKWYCGKFNANEKTYANSTKGRALNYALQIIDRDNRFKKVNFIGVVDADGRLDMQVLKEAAYKILKFGSKVLQGPVFQVSNFSMVSIVGKIAGLELSLHHLTDLSHRLIKDKFQFLAGTNYFIDKKLIIECGAWDQDSLVEDAELAMRLYITKKVKATWLSCPEVEQTVPDIATYCKQRERWVRGHFSLITVILQSRLSVSDKFEFISKIIVSQFRFLIDIFFPIMSYVFIILGLFAHLNIVLSLMSLVFFVTSILIWDTYGSIYRKLLPYISDSKSLTKYSSIKQSLYLFAYTPIMIFVQSVPRIVALYNFVFSFNVGVWYKTERTKELVIE